MEHDQAKTCTKCGETKPLEDFRRGKRYKGGRRPQCRTCHNSEERARRAENPKPYRESSRKWCERNREASRESCRRWREQNPDRKDKPEHIVQQRCSRRLTKVLKRLGLQRDRSTLDYLGLQTWEQLVEHVESLFAPGMTWENRDEWDLDHIEPFDNANDHDDILRIAHCLNIQVLWKHENRSKHTRLDWTPDELDRP